MIDRDDDRHDANEQLRRVGDGPSAGASRPASSASKTKRSEDEACR